MCIPNRGKLLCKLKMWNRWEKVCIFSNKMIILNFMYKRWWEQNSDGVAEQFNFGAEPKEEDYVMISKLSLQVISLPKLKQILFRQNSSRPLLCDCLSILYPEGRHTRTHIQSTSRVCAVCFMKKRKHHPVQTTWQDKSSLQDLN